LSNQLDKPYDTEGDVTVFLTDIDDDTLSVSFTRSRREDKPDNIVELRVYQYDGIGTIYFVTGADVKEFIDILQMALGELDEGTKSVTESENAKTD
jgi:hypothetical protein